MVAAPNSIMSTAAAVAIVFLLLAIESAGAWTLYHRRCVASSCLVLCAESPELSKTPSGAKHDCHSLSRRGALSKGIFYTGVAATLSLPSSSHADTSAASTSDAKSLLSNYNPSDYKTLPSYGRTVFPPPFLPPLDNRATYRYSLGRDAWALEQLLAFSNVTATIRTNVIKLEDGGLWVCGPLWPTDEYCALLDELGPVKHVVLPTNALEHKAAMKQFVNKYPDADVWISPGQYGPFGECGVVTDDMNEEQVNKVARKAAKTMGYRVNGILPVRAPTESKVQDTGQSLISLTDSVQDTNRNMLPSWSDSFDIEALCVEIPGNAGPVSECAFVHKPSMTLVVTDAVISVPSVSTSTSRVNDPTPQFPIQPIFSTYFDEATISDPTFWPRTVLQAVFLPLRTESSTEGTMAVYPGFEALTNRLVRAPILRAFADARAPDAVRGWVSHISDLTTFDRILSAHFASPINAGPDLFTKAFAHLDQDASLDEISAALPPISCQDWSTLNTLNDFIGDNKLGAPVVYDFRRGCL